MKTSSASAVSKQLTRSEYVSTLPPWRRLLATFNWRPVYDIEQETEQLRMRSLESARRTKQLESEIEQLRSESERLRTESSRVRSETEQIKKENARLAELNSKLDAIVFSSATNSTPAQPTPSESETWSPCWMGTAG